MSASVTATRSATAPSIRTARPDDADEVGRILVEAFDGINERYGFPIEWGDSAIGVQIARSLISQTGVFGIVAEVDGRVVGSCFLDERDEVRAIGPITVDPSVQGHRLGRDLMEGALKRAADAVSVRLLQDSFNLASLALYASLGFDPVEPVVLLRGRLTSRPSQSIAVSHLEVGDLAECAALCRAVHGHERINELSDSIGTLAPIVLRRDGRVVGYTTTAGFHIAGHGVAESEDDLRQLLLGWAALHDQPVSLLLPIRRAAMLRWALHEGLRGIKPMNLMVRGSYREPAGAWFPSVMA